MNTQDLKEIKQVVQELMEVQEDRLEKRFEKKFATKEDLKRLATKVDLKKLHKAIKEDIGNLEVSLFNTMKKSEEKLDERVTKLEEN